MKYRKKPVVIDAIRLAADHLEDDVDASAEAFVAFMGEAEFEFDDAAVYIHTLEGTMRADVGDWIIRGVKGELYLCKPDIFEATYEPV